MKKSIEFKIWETPLEFKIRNYPIKIISQNLEIANQVKGISFSSH